MILRAAQLAMTLFVNAAILLDGCSVLPSAIAPSLPATIIPAIIQANTLQAPTGTGQTTAAPISQSNFQSLAFLYQWNLGSDIAKITGAALSPTATKVALLTVRYPEQYSLELRESKTGDLVWQRSLDTKAAYSAVAFSPDKGLIAVGLGSGNVALRNVSDGSLSQTLTGPSYAVRAVAFSPDGSLIAAAGSDSMIHVWHVASGVAKAPYLLDNNAGNLIFSPNSRYLAAASDVFTLFDLSAGTHLPAKFSDAAAPHTTGEIAFSPDGRSLIAEGEQNDVNHNTWIPRVLIWNLSSNRPASTKIRLPDIIQNMVPLPDGHSILGYDPSKGQLELIDISSKAVAGTVDLGTVLFMDYSADLSRFLIVMKTSVSIWGPAR
jgi:WD40 repeat protein